MQVFTYAVWILEAISVFINITNHVRNSFYILPLFRIGTHIKIELIIRVTIYSNAYKTNTICQRQVHKKNETKPLNNYKLLVQIIFCILIAAY